MASISNSSTLPWRQNSWLGSSAPQIGLKNQITQGELCSCADQHHPDPYLTAMILLCFPGTQQLDKVLTRGKPGCLLGVQETECSTYKVIRMNTPAQSRHFLLPEQSLAPISCTMSASHTLATREGSSGAEDTATLQVTRLPKQLRCSCAGEGFPWCTPGGVAGGQEGWFCLLMGPLEIRCKSQRELEKLPEA